jgi:hypothetical protein
LVDYDEKICWKNSWKMNSITEAYKEINKSIKRAAVKDMALFL